MKIKVEKSTKPSHGDNFPIINPNAAGIDIGSGEHWVCVPKNRSDSNIRRFSAFTGDLYAIAKWLKECRIEVVAMESTGIYWIPLFQVLEEKGFKVYLVNARSVKNVPGRRKTDYSDCEWLQKLMTYGLLSASFIPEKEIRKLRVYLRQREKLVQISSMYIQHMQKSLHQMNILLGKVISDIKGQTGMSIIKAILEGEKDPKKLAKLRNGRIKCSEEEIEKSLEGNYQEEHLFTLEQSVKSYEHTQKQIEDCTQKILKLLKTIDKRVIKQRENENEPINENKSKKDNMEDEIREYLHGILGVDATKIPGLDTLSVEVILSETGRDYSKWLTDKHFASWLCLCPSKEISGGKELSNKTLKNKNRAAKMFRIGAMSLEDSPTYLGAFYRKMKALKGAAKAITATARKLSVIFFNMVKYSREYIELGADYYYKRSSEKMLKKLKKQAKMIGYELIPVQ